MINGGLNEVKSHPEKEKRKKKQSDFCPKIQCHGVWKSQKSLIQHCERSELRIHFRDKMGQTVLPDKSILMEQKLLENVKI